MRSSRLTETQIVSILNEAETGRQVKEVCLKHSISSPTFYKWKARYGGLGVSDLKRLKELETETALREWAYARSYETSQQRGQHLFTWLHEYNWHRPHASLAYLPPISRLSHSVNNLVATHN